MTENYVLWSEATNRLDFGEGIKVRIKNTTVTLKGVFLRNDNATFKEAVMTLASQQRVNEILTEAGIEQNPRCGDEVAQTEGRLATRVWSLVGSRNFQKKEKEKLLDMVADRDTTIRDLKKKVKELRNGAIDTAKRAFFTFIDWAQEESRVE